LAGTAPPIAFRDRSPTDGRSLALPASGREGRSILLVFRSFVQSPPTKPSRLDGHKPTGGAATLGHGVAFLSGAED